MRNVTGAFEYRAGRRDRIAARSLVRSLARWRMCDFINYRRL